MPPVWPVPCPVYVLEVQRLGLTPPEDWYLHSIYWVAQDAEDAGGRWQVKIQTATHGTGHYRVTPFVPL